MRDLDVDAVLVRVSDGSRWRLVHVDASNDNATLKGVRGGGYRAVSYRRLRDELAEPGGWEHEVAS
jgi:hypothetical protein